MKTKTGGPAYPLPVNDEQCRARFDSGYGGMSLRDYFAAKALQGLIASNDSEAGDRIEDIPAYAYQIADAMLKARSEGEPHD